VTGPEATKTEVVRSPSVAVGGSSVVVRHGSITFIVKVVVANTVDAAVIAPVSVTVYVPT
jgi:hypothetical protein